ncbi:MAG: hypothetical protein BWY85_00026 [Firmicutes bacterium ADurb.Bin506]|nr:MAG: hypothetical protein BWY85_00026 [Firmicutes bacterium ADurb.Bin506]
MKHLLLCLLLTGCGITIHIDVDLPKPATPPPPPPPAEVPDSWVRQRAEVFVHTPDPAKQVLQLAERGWYVTGRTYAAGFEKIIVEREYNAFRNKHRPVKAEAQ